MTHPTIGRIVHLRVGGTNDAPELRPATIVAVWSDQCVNLVVTCDGSNDDRYSVPSVREAGALHAWATSISAGEAIGQWRWPARA